jgi:hypothetical protein
MDRKKQISNFIDEYFNNEEWEEDKNKFIDKISNKFYKELEKYIFVENINDIKLGGYIRYVNSYEELKWGGILKKIIVENDKHYLLLANKYNNITRVCFEYNYIFYRNIITRADKLREIFISYLDEDKYPTEN